MFPAVLAASSLGTLWAQDPGHPRSDPNAAGYFIPEPQSAGGEIAERLEAAEAEIQALRQQLGTTPTAYQPRPTTPLEEEGIRGTEADSVVNRLSQVESTLQKSSQPTYPNFKISGFAQVDTATFSQSANSRAVLGDIDNGTGFRRTRLNASGNLTEQTKYFLEMDFAGAGRPSFTDVWVEQSDLPFFGNIRIGQFRQPITLDAAVNVRHLEFMEYSSSFTAFDPFRRVGIASWFLSDDESTFVNYSLYGTGSTFYNGTNPNNGATVYNSLGGDDRNATLLSDSGFSFAIRATHLLYWDEAAQGRYFLHVGGGYNYSLTGGSGTTGPAARTYEARTIPEIFVGDPLAGGTTVGGTPNVLDTGRFLADDFSIYHLETCGNYGSAHFQAEYVATVVNQAGGGQVFLDGGYVQVGYFLTGESCGYNKNLGAIDYNVVPYTNFFGTGRNGQMYGWGAWEIAGRASYLNLDGNVFAANQVGLPGAAPVAPNQTNNPNPFLVIPGGAGINQGQLVNVTMALNWWWNQNTRLQLNYIYSMANTDNGGDNTVTPAGFAAPAVNYGFNSMSAIAGRVQFEF